jgi:hypothetical protein
MFSSEFFPEFFQAPLLLALSSASMSALRGGAAPLYSDT